jgi:hypothetical protein
MDMAVRGTDDFLTQRRSPGLSQQTETQLTTRQASTSGSAELSIVTAEGDRVTLTAKTSAQPTLTDYRHLERNADGRSAATQVKSFEHASSREFSFVVEGDLSREELRDLKKVFKSVKQIIKKFFSGDLSGAMQKAEKGVDRFAKADSLASLDLSLDYTKSVSVTELTQRTQVAASENSLKPVNELQDNIRTPARPVSLPTPGRSDNIVQKTADPVAKADPLTIATAPLATKIEEQPDSLLASSEEDRLNGSRDNNRTFDKRSFRALAQILNRTMQRGGFDGPQSGKLMIDLVAKAVEDLKQETTLSNEAPRLDSIKEKLLDALATSNEVTNQYEVNQYQTSRTFQASVQISAFA